jgi:SAM-dependent methyltransferase
MSGSTPPPEWPSLEARRAGFERMYASDPHRFAGAPSRFSDWALAVLRAHFPRGPVLELGCGLGRDARRFAEAGYTVHATDYSTTAIDRAREWPGAPAGVRYEAVEAATALRQTESGTLVAVYAHALFMMLPESELETVFRETLRVLRPGGLHLFAVRATTDPVAGRGVEVAPDVYRRDGAPAGGGRGAAPYRFFRRETLDRWTSTGFERVAAELVPEIHFWFVADRRPP